jgi:hypothetical protein
MCVVVYASYRLMAALTASPPECKPVCPLADAVPA